MSNIQLVPFKLRSDSILFLKNVVVFVLFFSCKHIGRCINRRSASLRKFDFCRCKIAESRCSCKNKAVTAESLFPAASLLSARNVHLKTATFWNCSHGTVEAKVSDSVCVCRFTVVHFVRSPWSLPSFSLYCCPWLSLLHKNAEFSIVSWQSVLPL